MSDSETIISPFPFEIADGVFWLGECLRVHDPTRTLHSGSSVYLVAGERHSALLDAGINQHIPIVMEQTQALIKEHGLPDLGYAFLTHTEMPHAGAIGYILDRYPNAIAVGDTCDLHLVLPEFRDRLRLSDPGQTIDLGGRELIVVEGVFRDFLYTRWAFDTKTRTLFSGDGFSFTHDHDAAHCGKFTEDADGLDIPAEMSLFARAAFNWTLHVDIEPLIDRLEELVFDELDVAMIAPTHGLPIRDPRATLPKISEGLRNVSAGASGGGMPNFATQSSSRP
jgi:flavorubredoxin